MQLSNSSPSVNQQIYIAQVDHLYKNAPLAYVFTVLNGFLLTFLQRLLISNQILLTWFSILLLVTLARVFLVYAYHQTQSREHSIAYWHWAYIVGTAFAGGVWGSAAIYLFPDAELEHQLFVVFVLAGMTTASVSVLAASLVAFFLFALLTLFPLAIQVFLHDSSLSMPMAMMILLYLIGLSIAVLGMNRMILTSLRLRFDNHELMKEIVERQTSEEVLFHQKERLQITFSAMTEGVIITSSKGLIEYLNAAAEKMSGWVDSQARDRNVEQVFTFFDESTGESKQAAIYECLKNATRSKKNSLLLRRDGERRIIEEIATPLKDRIGNFIGVVAILRDITQESEYNRQLAYQASHDGLTGLPNRVLLADRIEHAINKAIRMNGMVAVLFMDLVRFKQINDRFGHAVGDILLRNVAQRLRESIREGDTVARFGGDEFVVVLEDVIYEDQTLRVAQKIVDNLDVPFKVEKKEFSIRVSIGISLCPRDGKNFETLLKKADTAMYRAKELELDNIQFYTEYMS